MAWVTSDLCHKLETTDMLLDGKCIVGDNAYVKKKYMTVPLKGIVGEYDDAYNFYAETCCMRYAAHYRLLWTYAHLRPFMWCILQAYCVQACRFLRMDL